MTSAWASEGRQLHGGECAGADVFALGRSVQRGLRRAAVDLGQRVLQKLNGGQNLWARKAIKSVLFPETATALRKTVHLHVSVTNQNQAFNTAVRPARLGMREVRDGVHPAGVISE